MITAITINKAGVATCLHTDKFDLGFLGRKSMERAGWVNFDESTQMWTVTIGDSVTYHSTYIAAVEYEIKTVNIKNKEGFLSGNPKF